VAFLIIGKTAITEASLDFVYLRYILAKLQCFLFSWHTWGGSAS
jgi:hypothetical protein